MPLSSQKTMSVSDLSRNILECKYGRIEELSGNENKRGEPLIKLVEEVAEEKVEEKPKTTRKRTTKKTEE